MSAEEEERVQLLLMPLAQAIVHELAGRGPLLKGEIVAATGASHMAVTLRVNDLERLGLLDTDADEPVGQRQGKRIRYSVNRDAVLRAIETLRDYLLPE